MPIDPHDGGPDDWFVPGSDGYPDDWFVPASAAPTTAQPAPGPQPGTANLAPTTRPTPRADPLAAFWSLIPASKWVTPPPIFPNSVGQFPLPPASPPSAPRIDPTLGLFGGLANRPATSGAPSYGLFGVMRNPPSANPVGILSFQGAGPASGAGDKSPPPSHLQKLTNIDSGNHTDQTGAALDQAPAATTSPLSESDTGLAQPVSCQGPTCSQGGSFGMTGMYIVSGRRLCRDCAVKFLGIQNLPAAEQTKILQNFLR
jgi:hypothetical protein